MSLPLTRRIARAALLIAAGAAPVVGAAGSAGAVELPQAPVGGLTALDTDTVDSTVDGVSKETTKVAGQAGGKSVEKAAPVATKTAGKAVGKTAKTATPVVKKTAKTATPVVKKAAGDTTGEAGGLVGGATKGGLPTDSLGGGGLPTGALGGLPLGG
ncbi:ATP-binding protein [Streptomyces sp. NPDC015127]|uniref:ATP-binding protein n=1 Tax=Streptomyces sp. NPDC015127 TaxID=3364939 RepID=UPI0036F69189